MIVHEREALLEEEVIIVRNSGEIPEIALHSSLYYLTKDEEGPGLGLQYDEVDALHDAASNRFKEIILRDLDPENRDLRIYRGLARTIANWSRFYNFCKRVGRSDYKEFRVVVSAALIRFIDQEYADINSGGRVSSVNCCQDELSDFLKALQLDDSAFPPDWHIICQK